jgi:hypothetical protein
MAAAITENRGVWEITYIGANVAEPFRYAYIRRGAGKSLAFPICSTTKRIFLGWVKEVRTTKS